MPTGIYHFINKWRLLEEVGDSKGIALMLPHPHVERLQPPVGQVAIKWTGNSSNTCRRTQQLAIALH